MNNMHMGIYSMPMIAALCYGFIELLKRLLGRDTRLKKLYTLFSAILGMILGFLTHLVTGDVLMAESLLTAVLTGSAGGLSATGCHELIQRMRKEKSSELIEEDPARYFITGDKHRHFERLIHFCKDNHLRKKDVIIILGDAGFNYYGDQRDDKLKAQFSKVNVTLLCLHGNKEKRPENIPSYGVRMFCGGMVYYEPKYPNIFFAKDGEVYNFNGKEFMAIGGAHSVDKIRCLNEGLPYWDDEMPSDEVKAFVERQLGVRGNKIFGFLTHTCPMSWLPAEMFVSTKRVTESIRKTKKLRKNREIEYPLDIDRSTEEWLERLREKVEYTAWYCGHYHIDKEIGNIRMMQGEISPFCVPEEK